MTPTRGNALLVGVLAIVCVTGLVDAIGGQTWDHAALFGAGLALAALLLARFSASRPAIPLRSDLVAWLQRRSQLTGESLERVTDRAVASYRSSLGEP